MKALTVSLALAAGLLLQAPAAADTLLIERVQAAQGKTLPARGQSMAQVEKAFGAPQQKFPPVAGPGDHRHNPPITRWVYPEFTVYFEHNHVVNAVLNKAHQAEIGPKPIE
ncbi:hypothetical protein [Arenimonas fontis]|uniref:Phosphodiesterase n=1 Tax=Arenimonas fontis TaxID=2608255 RepID=A0A5B2ZFM5_9GAMM|nr:hypothetical protein [Arenimonas fontis]KAA2286004.1 hypothetical protein F0415_00415 [Arenimonas fontis]